MAEERKSGSRKLELVVMVGLQASGRTTFYGQRFAASHELVSKDLFPRARRRQQRQMRLVTQALAEGRPVVVDNTNPAPEEWAPLVGAGRAHGARVVAYWFPPDLEGSLLRNARREGRARVPDVGVHATLKRLRMAPQDGRLRRRPRGAVRRRGRIRGAARPRARTRTRPRVRAVGGLTGRAPGPFASARVGTGRVRRRPATVAGAPLRGPGSRMRPGPAGRRGHGKSATVRTSGRTAAARPC